MVRRITGLLAALVATIACCASANAQAEFPSRTIRLLVGFPPGGSTDVLARTLANEVRATLGEVVIINKPGATGSLAMLEVLGATPDGYTLGIAPSSTFTLAHQFQNIRPDLLESSEALLIVGRQRIGMAVAKAGPHATLKDFIAAARKEPGKLSIGIPGAGTLTDLMSRAILAREKVEANVVPFQGDAPIVTAQLGGHITAGSFSAGGWAMQVREGGLRLIASMDADRSDAAPDVPTLLELGYPLKGNAVQYMLAPKGLPAPVRKRLTDAFLAASRTPHYVDIARKNALYEKETLTGAALDKQLLADRAELAALVNSLGLKKK